MNTGLHKNVTFTFIGNNGMPFSATPNTLLASRASRARYYEGLFIYSVIMLLGEKIKSDLADQQYNAVIVVVADFLTHFISMLATISHQRVDAVHFFSLPLDLLRKPSDIPFNPLLEESFRNSERALINMIKRSLFAITRRVLTLCAGLGYFATCKNLIDKVAVCVFLGGMIYSLIKRVQIMQESAEHASSATTEITQGTQDSLGNVSAAYSL